MSETLLDISNLCSDAQEMARAYVNRLRWANRHFGPWPPDAQDDRDMLEQAYEEAFDLTTYIQREMLRRGRAKAAESVEALRKAGAL